MTILGLDVSHYQGSPNWAQVKASGREFVVLKATESTNYVDPTFATNRRNAHAAGLLVGFYHFARGGNAAAEAAWFVRNVGALQSGEFLVLDWEITYAGDHVVWCKAWLDAVTTATGVAPLIYMNSSAMNAHNWMPLSGAHGLWLAKYDSATSAPTACNCWPAAAMKQYSDKGAVPGVGSCDVNAFYGTRDQLLAYGKGGSPVPTPPPQPTVQEDVMRLIHTPDGTIWKLTETSMEPEGNLATANALAKAYGISIVSMEYAEKDPVYLDAYARRNQLIADTAAVIDTVQTPTVDPAALAAALLADPANVDKLGAAIAAHLKLTSS